MAYDSHSIVYDNAGNPTSYYNGNSWTLGWENGRQLVSAKKGSTQISYTYDADGIRDSKTVGSVKYNFITMNGRVVRQTWNGNTLDIIYDVNGSPYACKYNGTYYIYVLNLQGDVIRIVDSTGATKAEYQYDAWGKVLNATGSMANINPIRYRGYYYDTETGFYYLQSRYYDPVIGRFINADDPSYLGANGDFVSYNLFAYCHNNPVNMADSGGNLAFFVATGIAGAVIGGIVGYATTGTWKGALAGAAIGGAAGLGGGAGAAYLLAGKATASVGAVVIGANLQLAGAGATGYGSFRAFKAANGSAGQGKAWHHIVGQTTSNINQFGAQMIHKANNLVKIAHGAGTLHNRITSHYNSIQPYTNGQVVHKWLESQSFRAQYNYGLELLYKTAKELGATIEYALN